MQLTSSFKLNEFVPRKIYERFGEKSIQFIDMRMVNLVQMIRDNFDVPITINNWATGGTYNESGFRDALTKNGAELSQHKMGRAADLKFKGKTAKEVYDAILADREYWYEQGLRCMEDINHTPTWLHIDIRETKGYGIHAGNILIVKP